MSSSYVQFGCIDICFGGKQGLSNIVFCFLREKWSLNVNLIIGKVLHSRAHNNT